VTAVGTGARLGELLGLRWGDIDFESKTISIQRTLLDHNGRIEVGEPKTARSRRRIDLPDFIVTALKSHRLRSPAQPHPTAWVFIDANGGPLRKCNLMRRSFHPLLERAGLPKVRFHDLRHTAASLLFAEGVHPKVVQERLGHATIAITLDTYSHVIPTMQKEAATQLDALLASRNE
jgi:integrase